MRVLLDHCVPRSLRLLLVGQEVKTARQMGWSTLRNGDLLRTAAPEFGAFLSVDQGIDRDYGSGPLPMPVLLLIAHTNRRAELQPLVPAVLLLLQRPLELRLYCIDRAGLVERTR